MIMIAEYKTLINNFIESIIECIVKEYSYDIEEVKIMVSYSSIDKLLKTHPQFVLHYSIQYWANDIVNDYNELQKIIG